MPNDNDQNKIKQSSLNDFKPKKKDISSLPIKKSNPRFNGFTLEELIENLKKNQEPYKTLEGILIVFKSEYVSSEKKKDFASKIHISLRHFLIKPQEFEIRKSALLTAAVLLSEYLNQVSEKKLMSGVFQIMKKDRSPILREMAGEIYNERNLKKKFSSTELEAYEKLMEFELSMRKFLFEKLNESYDENWFNNGFPQTIQIDIKEEHTKKLKQDPNFSCKEIDLMDFSHISGVICYKNNWKNMFSKIFPDQVKLKATLDDLNRLRNDLAHPPLFDKDVLNHYDSWINYINKFK